MIDGIEISGDGNDLDIMIELLEVQMFPAKLRWAADGKAGLDFIQTFNMERLQTTTTATQVRNVA